MNVRAQKRDGYKYVVIAAHPKLSPHIFPANKKPVNLSVASLTVTVTARLVLSIMRDVSNAVMCLYSTVRSDHARNGPSAPQRSALSYIGIECHPIDKVSTLARILTPYLFSLYRVRYCIAPCT
jgi:hypothetical protein